MLIMMRKGISPVIATVLLIGVAVFAVGAIFTFTQGQIGDLQGSTGAPQASLSIDAAARDTGSAWNMGGRGIILMHNEGDAIPLDAVDIIVRSDNDPTPVTISPTIDREWDSGQQLGIRNLGPSGTPGIALPDQSVAPSVQSEGSNGFSQGDNVNVVIQHRATGNVIFEDSQNVISVINSFI